ncbi:hypothetical protein [Roseobacter sinensis]|uniref:Uncharacterized protein n=1 Tax=Roseobacter sinensis TaxID=2931391 RepID=A0ABT3BCZ1_9RHOB|nr:hypothetical protein [Roseobacter sp. WL0113]MCV3271444.1 hypothetical protein [Roseobacter sp. WL0113]
MPTTRILTALMLGLIGFWALTLVSEGEANHILISDTAARTTHSGGLVVTFQIENRGAPDRLSAVASTAGEASLRGAGARGLTVPSGVSWLTAEAGHIRLETAGSLMAGDTVPLRMEFETAGQVSAIIRYQDTSAEETAARLSRFERPRDMAGAGLVPSVTLSASPDGEGWRVALDTEHFAFDGQSEAADAPIRGYAELFADGTRLGRIADPVVRIGALPSGPVALRVVLSALDGTPYFSADGPVADTIRLTVP